MKLETSFEWQIIEHPYLVMCIEIVRFYSLLWYHAKQSLSDFLFGQYLALMHYIHTFCL